MVIETPAQRSTRHMAERAAVIADSTYRGWNVHYEALCAEIDAAIEEQSA